MASDKESPTVKDLKAVGEMLGMDTTSKSKSISKYDIKKLTDSIYKSKSGCEMINRKWINGECIPKSEIRKGRKKGTDYPDRE